MLVALVTYLAVATFFFGITLDSESKLRKADPCAWNLVPFWKIAFWLAVLSLFWPLSLIWVYLTIRNENAGQSGRQD